MPKPLIFNKTKFEIEFTNNKSMDVKFYESLNIKQEELY